MTWTWLITIASLIGVIANIYQKRWCFWIWVVTNASWFIIDWQRGLPEQATLFAVYFALAIWGLWQWKTEPA